MTKTLIAYATTEGQTAKIAGRIGAVLGECGHEAVVADVETLDALTGFGAVILGGSIHAGHLQKRLVQFVEHHHDALRQLPTAFFTVCLTAAGTDAKALEEIHRVVAQFEHATGFSPDDQTVLAGALKYRSYGIVKRFLMKLIAQKSGGDTDTSRDYEYTDWAAVDAFARHFAGHLDEVDCDSARRPVSSPA